MGPGAVSWVGGAVVVVCELSRGHPGITKWSSGSVPVVIHQWSSESVPVFIRECGGVDSIDRRPGQWSSDSMPVINPSRCRRYWKAARTVVIRVGASDQSESVPVAMAGSSGLIPSRVSRRRRRSASDQTESMALHWQAARGCFRVGSQRERE